MKRPLSNTGRRPVSNTALAVLVAVVLTGCGSDQEPINPELTARTMLERELVKADYDAEITDVSCVEEDDRRFQCVVRFTEDGREQRVAGLLLCEEGSDAQCLWRPDV